LFNAVPHFVHGISGDKFPTPFAKPPGQGLSPAYINVLWAGLNMAIGYILLKTSHLQTDNCTGMIVLFIGGILMALMLSKRFTTKHKE
jgi:hypothetical protein